MSGTELRVLVWNLEWRPPQSGAADIIRSRIDQLAPDIVCLTESVLNFLRAPGHVIASDPDYGYRLTPGRRKVLLWSREPWSSVDPLGSADMPAGRYVAGRTETPIGKIGVAGVCVPYAQAHVATGRRDRRTYQDHLAYLDALGPLLTDCISNTLVMGDFNQRIPRRGQPLEVFKRLEEAVLQRFSVPTGGAIEGEQVVDHVAHTGDLRTLDVQLVRRQGPAGEYLSDHDGLFLRLAPAIEPDAILGKGANVDAA